MKKTIFLCLLLNTGTCFAQTFYKKFPTSLILDYDVGAVEISNGYLLGDNEVNSAVNFHSAIRLTHTDYSGNIIWAKRYDAGSGTSVHLYQLLITTDHYLLATGYVGPDNNAVGSQRLVMKLDTSGNVVWCKQYASSVAYRVSNIVQLSDTGYVFSMGALSGGQPVLCRVDSSGNVLSAAKYNLAVAGIDNIVMYNNSLDLILSTFYILNTDLSGSTINWQRQYNNSMQFNSLLSNRCSNGDILYMAGQHAGGFGDGISRIFRTDSAGNLKWSKNILAWSGPVSNAATNFDVVTHIAIHEEPGGNVVGVSLDEGGTLLFTVFDSTGTYLYNRNRIAVGQNHCVTETTSGNYLAGSVFAFQTFSTFSSYPLVPANPCDSILNVSITNGVDSSASMPPVTISALTVAVTNVLLAVSPTTISSVVFCNPTVGIAGPENSTPGFFIYPNPAKDVFTITSPLKNYHLEIFSVLGKKIHEQNSTSPQTEINLGNQPGGIYFVQLKSEEGMVSGKIVLSHKP